MTLGEDACAKALADQFGRSWEMVLEAVRAFPEEEWRVAEEDRYQPARIVHHLLFAADRYTWSGAADAYAPKRAPAFDWAKSPVESLPDRETALRQVEQAKADSLAWVEGLGSSGLVGEKAMWAWTGESALAQGIYHLRHLQHHMAELNVELRRRGLATVKWR